MCHEQHERATFTLYVTGQLFDLWLCVQDLDALCIGLVTNGKRTRDWERKLPIYATDKKIENSNISYENKLMYNLHNKQPTHITDAVNKLNR